MREFGFKMSRQVFLDAGKRLRTCPLVEEAL
jgi:hypothetical protein